MAESFFDFRDRVMQRTATPQAAEAAPLTVSQVTAKIDRAIKSGVPGQVLVKGEISNFKGQ